MLRIVCEHCTAALKAPPTLAGKALKCPKCGGTVRVPPGGESKIAITPVGETEDDAPYRIAGMAPSVQQETTNTASTSQAKPRPPKRVVPPKPLAAEVVKQRLDAILEGFKGEFKRPRRGIGYRISELIVLVLVLLLPVIYVGMIASVGWLVYQHAVHNTWMMAGHGRAIIFGFMIYAALLVGGGAVLFAMVMPIFGVGRQEEPPRRSLTHSGEPVLFALVDHLCETLGAPKPSRIDVDCDVNASAGFRRGLFSFFGSDVVLTIGLPLAAGLTAKQLIGVLAHEFGHFTQGFSSRLQYTIGSILRWFAHAAAASAGLGSQVNIESGGSAEGCGVAFAAWIVRSCLWIGRQALYLCFLLGLGFSMSLLRKREYDADAYEFGLVGAKTFESTFRSMHYLGEGWAAGIKTAIDTAPSFHGLPEDIPGFAAAIAAAPSGAMLQADKKARKHKSGVFDTHPSPKDRIAAAKAAGAPGVFESDLPASALFTNFAALCKNSTFDFYRHAFSPTIKLNCLVPNDGLLELGRRHAGCVAAAARTF